jgi:hypothetical protein
MQGRWRMLAMLLLVIAATLRGTQALASPAMPADPPAGCHSDSPALPSPAPSSHQCCVNGHHAAIPNALFSDSPLAAQLCSLAATEQLRLGFVPNHRPAAGDVSSSSPPGVAPLRI